jgi:malate dehydrogenase (oxaloacetate-decarboxylating)
MSGAGAAGTAVIKLLLAAGARDVVVADIAGVVHRGRADLIGELEWLAENTNQLGFTGSVNEAVVGADVFIGLSVAGVLSGSDVAAMADRSIVFALANPVPEVDPAEASGTRRWWPRVVRISRIRSTMCSRSLGCFVACSMPIAPM